MGGNLFNDEQREKSRVRSPNFPGIDLREAIDKVQLIYSKDKRNATNAEVIVKHLGYSQLHGKSRRVLSALKQYGLLEERAGGLFRVSDNAYRIIHLQEDSKERYDLVQ